MLKAFRQPKSFLRQRPALSSPAWHQSPKPSRREGVHHGGHWVISSSRQMHHGHTTTSPWSPTKGSCLTECYLPSPNSRSSWSHAGVLGLGQGELSPSSLHHQLRAKMLLFWKDCAGWNGNKRSYTTGVLNTWAPGPSYSKGFSEGSRQVWRHVPWSVPALNTVITQFQVLANKNCSQQKKHNPPNSSRGPGHLPGLSDALFFRGMHLEAGKYSPFWLQDGSPSKSPRAGQFGRRVTACGHRRWLIFLFVRKAEEAGEQGLTKAYKMNIQLCSPFSVFRKSCNSPTYT